MNPSPPHPLPPCAAGIGLRAEHHAALLELQPRVDFVEVHSENYFGRGGPPMHWLRRARERCALSLHGVGLSIGSVDPLRADHLRRLRELIDEVQPALVSEHLSWSCVDGRYANDLLPLPFTREALERGHVDAVIAQNMGHLARSALRVLRALADGRGVDEEQERLRIEIVIRENLPSLDEAGAL